jgi:hypothetical protein
MSVPFGYTNSRQIHQIWGHGFYSEPVLEGPATGRFVVESISFDGPDGPTAGVALPAPVSVDLPCSVVVWDD